MHGAMQTGFAPASGMVTTSIGIVCHHGYSQLVPLQDVCAACATVHAHSSQRKSSLGCAGAETQMHAVMRRFRILVRALGLLLVASQALAAAAQAAKQAMDVPSAAHKKQERLLLLAAHAAW